TAVADSPLYPASLTGSVYLTGQLLAPAVSIVFPPPFPITLNGTLDLGTNTTTFTGIPDIPLTSLRVTLAGGPAGAFLSTCETPSGTATAALTAQNGHRTVKVPSAFTVADCRPPATFVGSVGSAGGSVKRPTRRRPAILSASVKGLATGRPTLTFTLIAGKGHPKIRSLTVTAPSGLRFITHRVHRHRTITGVSASRARIRSRALRHGHLAIALRRAVARLGLKITHGALRESPALRRRVRHRRLKRLTLTVLIRDARGHRSTLHLILHPRR
ncbi:MAG TPA: hypothetical protein VE127_01690, partial [Solirubrobacteraceae bacterium]|nr:hypothetical protein [Solirubrobacteraceae bacterium]